MKPQGAVATSAAASEIVAASQGKHGPCRIPDPWEATATKVGASVQKVQLACRKQMERVEDAMEVALGNPKIRDKQLREKICLGPKKKGTCKSLWSDEEVPVSKARAEALREEARLREEKEGLENDRKALAFFKANKQRAGVESLSSGLQIKVLKAGQGAGPPSRDQKVTVHYRGINIDCVPQDGPLPCSGGTEFDSTYSCKEGTPSAERQACEKNKPIAFTANQADSFWPDVLSRMQEGSHLEAYVPYKLAYGSIDDPSKRPVKVGAKAALIFQIELVKVHDPGDAKVVKDAKGAKKQKTSGDIEQEL